MRTTSIFDLDTDPAVNLQIYRTDEALFIYRPSRISTVLKKWLRPTLIASFVIFLVVLAAYVLAESTKTAIILRS